MREAVVDFPAGERDVPTCTQVKSTLIGASVLSLKEHGLFDAYLAHLPRELHDTVVYTPAGVWLPAATAVAHYAACDALDLPSAKVLALGSNVAKLTQKTVLSFMLRLVREAGTTPWTVLEQTPRLWGRVYMGSALAVYRNGPKDAELVFVGNPCAEFRYWRIGLAGIIDAICRPFASRLFVREPTRVDARHRLVYRASWA
jgi:hypothetical protein